LNKKLVLDHLSHEDKEEKMKWKQMRG